MDRSSSNKNVYTLKTVYIYICRVIWAKVNWDDLGSEKGAIFYKID